MSVITAYDRMQLAPGTAMGASSSLAAHQHIAQRAPRGRHILAKKSSHRTMTSDEPELIVAAIRSIVEMNAGGKS